MRCVYFITYIGIFAYFNIKMIPEVMMNAHKGEWNVCRQSHTASPYLIIMITYLNYNISST